MEENNVGDGQLGAALEFEKNYRKRLQKEMNVALGMDFVTNLASMLARSRGARYSINTNNTAAVNKKIADSEQRILEAQRDYYGRLAALAFRDMLNGSKGDACADVASAGREPQRRALFSSPVSLLDGRAVPRRPQMMKIKPFTPAKLLPGKYNYEKHK